MLPSLQDIWRKRPHPLAGSPVRGRTQAKAVAMRMIGGHLHLLSVVLKAGADVCKIYKARSPVEPGREKTTEVENKSDTRILTNFLPADLDPDFHSHSLSAEGVN